jgi:hypothetical protein
MSQVLVILFSLFVSTHEYHVTHSTIYYNAHKESVEITINVALEDLELALEDQTDKKINIGTVAETPNVDSLIENYFRQRFILSPNNRFTPYEWVGKEVSADLHNLYVYLEIPNCNQGGMIESLYVENTIFTDLLPDQANIVLIEHGSHSHNLTFSIAQKSQTVILNP